MSNVELYWKEKNKRKYIKSENLKVFFQPSNHNFKIIKGDMISFSAAGATAFSTFAGIIFLGVLTAVFLATGFFDVFLTVSLAMVLLPLN